MILDVIFRYKTIHKSLIITLLLCTNLFAFNTIMEDVFTHDKDLINYKKQLQTYKTQIKTNPLESALAKGFNQEEELKTLKFKKENDLVLKSISLYFNILKNDEILSLYKEADKKYLKKEKSSKDINDLIKRTKTRLEKENNFLKKSLNDFQNFTGNSYKKTNLKKVIHDFTLPRSPSQAYAKFLSLEEYKKKATFVAIHTDMKSKFLHHLEKHYAKYNFLTKDIKTKEQKLEQFMKETLPKDYFKRLEHKEKIIHLKANLISTKYNFLFSKCKISYIIGTLMTDVNFKTKKPNIKKMPILKAPMQKTFRDMALKRIHFSGNSTAVSSYSIVIVRNHAKKLLKIDNYMLELHGYSDSKGSKKENYELSQKRVEETKKELIKLGIDKNKIKTFAHGDKKPIANNKTKKGRLLNRRVEFRLYKDN